MRASACCLPALGLRNKGDGTYYVIQGRNYLYDQKGQPIIINLNGQPQPQQVKK